MKTILFSLIFALCIALINADGKSYYATFYGGSDDHDAELNPSCGGGKHPDTDYYAAVGTLYGKKLCGSYAVVMAVDLDGEHDGKMVKVKVIDSCHECKDSHIDLSRDAFTSIRDRKDGEMKVIWVAATSDGDVTRDVIYPSSATESFAKKYGLSKAEFVSMYKKQALSMIKNRQTHGKFDKNAFVVKTTTTTTTTRQVATKTIPVSGAVATNAAATKTVPNVPAVPVNSTVSGLGDITIITEKAKNDTTPENAPIVGKTKTVDPNKTDYTEEDIKVIESNFNEKEEEGGSYTVGVLSAALTVSGAAGIGLIYLKKQSPSKYDELKQKFPEAFDNVKRSVTRSATTIKRGLTRTTSKKNRTNVSRHGDHSDVNYREMPEHMFGKDGLPRVTLYDQPMNDFPETAIKM